MKLTREKLLNTFIAGQKPPQDHKVGLEYEVFGMLPSKKWTLPFEGTGGVEETLKNISSIIDLRKCYENKKVTELHSPKKHIFLEPGGQIELSSTPVSQLADLDREINETVQALLQSGGEKDLHWMALGIHPFAKLEDIPWVPKGRYQIMSRFFKEKGGPLAHLMMKQTASIQINVDYESEKDAVEKFRLLMALSPIFTAIFANSSIYEGKVSPFLSKRASIWQQTDPKRCGLLKQVFDPNFSYEEYLDMALSIPMMMVKRGEQWIPIKDKTFGEFLEKGQESLEATLEDWMLHLSTIFTEVRLKQVLELRSIDSHLPPMAMAAAALVKGLIYDTSSREGAWELVKNLNWEERVRLLEEAPKLGLQTLLKNGKIIVSARELLRLSKCGLKSLSQSRGMKDESEYLIPIQKLLRRGKTAAEESSEVFQESPEEWIKKNELKGAKCEWDIKTVT